MSTDVAEEPRRFYVVEYHGNQEGSVKVVHVIAMPDVGQTGWYRSVTSFNGFMNRASARHKVIFDKYGVSRHNERWFYTNNWYEEAFTNDFALKCEILGIDFYEHAKWKEWSTLWAFYEAIGYDHKRNKWSEDASR